MDASIIDLSAGLAFDPKHRAISSFGLGYAYIHPVCSIFSHLDTVNVDRICFIPHAHSTHTECILHLSKGILEALKTKPIELSWIQNVIPISNFSIVTIMPSQLKYRDDWSCEWLGHDSVPFEKVLNDNVISWSLLNNALKSVDTSRSESLIIKCIHGYEENNFSGRNSPYFTPRAMYQLRVHYPLIHNLLVDLPSVDKEEDDGHLLAHKYFFGFDSTFQSIDQQIHDLMNSTPPAIDRISELIEMVKHGPWLYRSITELCRIPLDALSVNTAAWRLNLQLLFLHASDAVPARPILIECSQSK